MGLIKTFKNFSGIQKLRLILWIRGFGLVSALGMGSIRILYCFTGLFDRPAFCHHLNPTTKFEQVYNTVGHTSFVYVVLNALHWVYLWKAIRMNSRFHWKCYLATRVLLDIWGTAMWIILSSNDHENVGVKYYLHLSVTPLTIVCLGIFEFLIVRNCYKKLDAPIILELRKVCKRIDDINKKEYYIKNEVDEEAGDFSNLELDEKLIINSLDITIDKSKFLGGGQYGMVFQGILQSKHLTDGSKTPVAVKMLKDGCELDTVNVTVNEIKIFGHAGKHPNVAKFYGVSSDASNPSYLYLVMELCELGSLSSYLPKNTYNFKNWLETPKPNRRSNGYVVTDPLTTLDLIRFSYQVATGMEYLGSKHIIHGDLAARNVLLSADKIAKVTDFGLSRKLYNYELYIKNDKGMALPWKWMSIESLEDFKFSKKSDVWSFGILLWEIFSLGDTPYHGTPWSLGFVKQLRNGMRLQKPNYCPEEIYKTMTNCWEPNPENRPTFSELVVSFSEQNKKTQKDFLTNRRASQQYVNASLMRP